LDADYSYLLGLYLGDGMLTRAPKNVWKLRIVQDTRYPGLIERCASSIAAVSGHSAGFARKQGCVDIYSTWKHWLCLFPQHGSGEKHHRKIGLATWQRAVVELYPREFLAGLVHSDGARVLNVVYRPLKDGLARYEYPRYHFTNASDDIRRLFAETCALIGVDCRPNNARNLSVAKRRSVAILDSFIGPKR
jgi:hypothetical protein